MHSTVQSLLRSFQKSSVGTNAQVCKQALMPTRKETAAINHTQTRNQCFLEHRVNHWRCKLGAPSFPGLLSGRLVHYRRLFPHAATRQIQAFPDADGPRRSNQEERMEQHMRWWRQGVYALLIALNGFLFTEVRFLLQLDDRLAVIDANLEDSLQVSTSPRLPTTPRSPGE